MSPIKEKRLLEPAQGAEATEVGKRKRLDKGGQAEYHNNEGTPMTVAPLRLDKNNRLTLRVQAVISFYYDDRKQIRPAEVQRSKELEAL